MTQPRGAAARDKKDRTEASRDHAAPAAAAGPLLVHMIIFRHFAAEHGLGHPLVVAQLVAQLLDFFLFRDIVVRDVDPRQAVQRLVVLLHDVIFLGAHHKGTKDLGRLLAD